ncbi:MAG: hypothetical protein ACTHNO_23465 [Ralstonia sp.]|uniref:hypothetical protein n=1 Tax=Ralstonia sp. TaxID=54061 RepID=UPI003F809095
MQVLQLPADGSSLWAGMDDIELITPDGRHHVHLRYEGEPPHGDSYHLIQIDGVPAPGYAWGCTFACTPDSRLLAMSWMEKRIERKTAVFDLEGGRYFVLPFYMGNFCFRWPRLECVDPACEQRSYAFNGNENWLVY